MLVWFSLIYNQVYSSDICFCLTWLDTCFYLNVNMVTVAINQEISMQLKML